MEKISLHIIITQNNVNDYINVYNKHVLNGLEQISNVVSDLLFLMNETIYIHIDNPVNEKTIYKYLDSFCSKLTSSRQVSSVSHSFSHLPCSNKCNLYYPILDKYGDIIQNRYLVNIIK